MSDDGGNVGADILHTVEEGAKEIGSIAASELKQAVKAAFSQVTGKPVSSFPPAPKPTYYQLTGSTGVSPMGRGSSSWFDELKKFGHAAGSQIVGQQPNLSSESLAQMVKKDNEFSKKEAEAIAARINQIYAQYAAKKAKELEQQKLAKQQEEKQKKVQKEELKKQEQQQPLSSAVAKTRPEIKNYGAE